MANEILLCGFRLDFGFWQQAAPDQFQAYQQTHFVGRVAQLPVRQPEQRVVLGLVKQKFSSD